MHDDGFWHSVEGWAVKLLLWVGVFLAPARSIMLAVLFLVLSDIVTGIWAARKRGEKITSSRFVQKLPVTAGYLFALLLAHVTQQAILPDIPVLHAVAGLVASTELMSAYENLSTIVGLPLVDVIRGLFTRQPPPPPSTPK